MNDDTEAQISMASSKELSDSNHSLAAASENLSETASNRPSTDFDHYRPKLEDEKVRPSIDLDIKREVQTSYTKWRRSTLSARIFMCFLVFQFLTFLSVSVVMFFAYFRGECYNAQGLEVDCSGSSTITYGILFIISSCFALHFGIRGVLWESVFDLGTFVAGSFLVTVYAVYHAATPGQNKVEDVLTLAVALVCQVAYIPLLYKIYHEIEYKIYLPVGPSEHHRKMYRNWMMYQSMLKFDLEMAVTASITGGLLFYTSKTALISNIFEFLVPFPRAVLGYFCIREANHKLFSVFITVSFFEPFYILYKIVAYFLFPVYGEVSKLQLLVIAFMALFARIAVLYLGFWMRQFFDQGLKPMLDVMEESKQKWSDRLNRQSQERA